MYHGGYKFGAAQVNVITDEKGSRSLLNVPQMLKSEASLVDRT